MGRIYYEQKGLINLDDIVDIFIEVGNIHNYLENAALRILLLPFFIKTKFHEFDRSREAEIFH